VEEREEETRTRTYTEHLYSAVIMSILFGDPVTPRDVVLSQRAKRLSKSQQHSRNNLHNNLKDLSLHDNNNNHNNNNNNNNNNNRSNISSRDANREEYVCSLTKEDIVSNSVNKRDEQASTPGEVVFLDLSNKRLSDVSMVDLCERMTICNLSTNYLKNIAPLKWCVNLYYLDIHSNQITCLPDEKFWSSLKMLHVLYLHDNGIGRMEELRDLSHAVSLMSLTLYDTPLSLKKNYRHCVVNALWSLKSLDFCVVSDEEIIEDANFSKIFKPMQPHFRFKPNTLTAREDTSSSPWLSLKEARSRVYRDVGTINRIQGKYCPVLMIQKLVRGHLIRLRYNYVMDTRLWAAVSIQRYYRTYKGIPNPPPSTPMLHYQDFIYQSMSSIKLDYEEYLKMKRSIDPAIFASKSVHFNENDWKLRGEFNGKALRKRISINLEKLMGKATEMGLSGGGEHISNTNIVAPHISSDLTNQQRGTRESEWSIATTYQQQQRKTSEQFSCVAEEYAKDLGLNVLPSATTKDHLKVGKYYTQFKFLGPMEHSPLGDLTDVGFRLSIKRPPLMKHDPLDELAIRTVEGADDIRNAIKNIDEQRKKSVPKKVKRIPLDNSRRTQSTSNMGFSCFRAIDKAYRDRSKMEETAKRCNTVKHLKEVEDLSLEQVRAHNFSTRNIAAIERKKDKMRVMNALAARKQKQLEELDRIDAKRNASEEKRRRNKRHYDFALQFNCQNASVGKALANHDRGHRKQEIVAKNVDRVTALRGAQVKKRELITGCLESARVGRQMENMCMRRNLEAVMSTKLAERVDEQINRLKGLKQNKGIHMAGATLLPVKQFKGPAEEVDYF